MEKVDRPVVIGGGAAGLAACLTLEEAGYAPVLLEASDRLGGRLRTERMPDGTPVDVGFQVLLTAYPELRRWVDVAALDAVRFVPGAKIHKGGTWRTVADPRRRPGLMWATLRSGIGTMSDRWRILRFALRVMRGPAEDVQSANTTGTALEGLRTTGFSDGFIQDFLRPFFSGIFLDRELTPPPAQLAYTLRMFASGDVVRPRAGMEALVSQLQKRLVRTEVRCHARVLALDPNRIQWTDGTLSAPRGIICTVPGLVRGQNPVQWNGCVNAVFSVEGPGFGWPIIGLIPDAQVVTNFHFMEAVQGDEGRGKLNATATWDPNSDVSATLDAMAVDLRQAGLNVGECLWHAAIPQALPRLAEVVPCLGDPQVAPGIWVAGDVTAAPSLDAALRSGRRAAESWIQSNPGLAS